MIRRTKGQAELIEDVIKAEAVGSHFLCCLVLFGARWLADTRQVVAFGVVDVYL